MTKGSAFPSNFLKSEDIGDKELVLTISKVENEELGQGQEKETKPVLSFKETDKKLVCNVTNWDAIEKVTGKPDSDDWVGEKITLITMQVQFGGKITMGIRVSLKKPAAAAFKKPLFAKTTPKPESPLRALLAEAKITEPVLMEFLVASIDGVEEGMTIDTLPERVVETTINQWDEFAAKIREVVG